jgi:PPP family 3-phenylpropionic acid transporter
MLVAGTPMLLLLTLVVHPIGFPLFLPTIVRYINEIMDTREAVRGQSMYVMVITVSGVVASSTGGIVLDSLGAGALLWICAITCVIGAVVILPLIEKAREE